MARVELQNVTKCYDNETVVRSVNLQVANGEFLVLVGPSGCGKSTTLRMIAGLEEISSGHIYIGEHLINNVPPKDRDIAMVFQNYALYPHMTVFDNMAFGLKLRKIPKSEINERVAKTSAILGLEGLLNRKPKALSGGQKQRVAMGRAIVRKPAVFLFDEPLSNLDAKMRVEMRKEILQLHRRLATTMVYVTHDQIEAMTLGDRICVMNNGAIEQIGSPTTIFDHPASLFVAGFIGTPAMNIFEGVLIQNNGLHFNGGNFLLPLPESKSKLIQNYEGRRVHLGIRPRALNLVKPDQPAPHSIAGQIDVSEMLGEEILLHVTSGEHQFIASIHPHEAPAMSPGKVHFSPYLNAAHIFDADTGRNLTLPAEVAQTTLPESSPQ